MNNNITKKDIIILIFLILSIGAYFGALFADTNWKADLKKFSVNNTQFAFDNSGKFYTIESHMIESKLNYSNLTFINKT